MVFYRRHWYTAGIALGVVLAIYLALAWSSLEVVQRIMLLNFIAFLVHQFEEYGWPGGEPSIMNKVLRPSDALPDRYPLNQNSAVAVNVFMAYPFYVIPIFFPHQYWLGLPATLFGFGQVVVHGVWTNIKLHWFYNPGFGAVVFGHVPIGIAYIVYISRHGATVWDWVIGVILTFGFMFVALVKATYDWLADRNSRYPFAEIEMQRGSSIVSRFTSRTAAD